MRKNAKHSFVQRADKPALTISEAKYWRAVLPKILKVGFEFEVNLPEAAGQCEGDSLICPCSHPDKETSKCYQKCAVFTECRLRDNHECPGQYCVEFVSPCPTCDKYVKDCKNCDLYKDPRREPKTIRNELTEELKPTDNLMRLGKFGTYQVVKDGSLNGDGGVEITTVGRRVSYQSFFDQAKNIIEHCKCRGAYINERASTHMHLVGGYYELNSTDDGNIQVVYTKGKQANGKYTTIKDLEKPLPEIVIANFLQLVRRYHNALTWISSSGSDINTLTRWVKFRKPILKYSPLRTNMRKVIQEIAEADGHHGKYSFVNFFHTKFDKDSCDIDRLHIESRFCDGLFSPSAVASLGVLLYAFMVKAVVLSQHGLIQSGTNEYMQEAYDIQKKLMNNDGGYDGPRTSDTSNFAPYKEVVRKQAAEMVEIMKPILKRHSPSYKVLVKLADSPCSVRLCNGDSWDDIERDLAGTVEIRETVESRSILEAVDTVYIDECENTEEWAMALSEETNIDMNRLKEAVSLLVDNEIIVWDQLLGTYTRG